MVEVVRMKARSKASKLRNKRLRGRPKLEGIYRQPNGQPSRAKNPPQKVAVEARARLTGISLELAKDPRSATNLGRLVILEEQSPNAGITTKQYDAVLKYLEIVNDYKKSLCSPGAHWDKPTSISSGDEKQYAEWCKRAKQRYKDANDAIAEGQRENPFSNFDIVLKHVIFRDIAMPRYIGDLRLLCNILHKHFNPQKTASEKNKIYSWVSLSTM